MSSSRNRRPRASRRREGAAPSFSLSPSDPPSARHLRVQSTLFQDVSLLFRSELSDPRLEGVRLTSFELTPDGRLICIGYSLSPEAAASGAREVQEVLVRASGYLRAQLAQHLNLKRVPQLRFISIGVVEHPENGSGPALPIPSSSPPAARAEAPTGEDTLLDEDGDEEGGAR